MPVIAENRSQQKTERSTKVFEINPLVDPRWHAFVERHPHSSVFHRIEWLRALKSCYGYVPVALSTSSPDAPIENGILCCEVRSWLTGNRLVSLPFSDHCEPLVSDAEELDVLLKALKEQIDVRGWKYFELRPIFSNLNGHSRLGVSDNYYFHRLDLRSSQQILFKGFHKDCVQRKIRRAEREGLRYEEGSSDVLLDAFYELLILTRRRQSLPPQPLNWFRSLISCLGSDLKIRVAFKGEIPVASILTISNKKVLVYKYGCSDSRFNNLGGTAFLFWNAIQDAKARGIEELDMGRSDMDNPGLVAFKEHWGAQRSTVNYWRYPSQAAASKPESLIKYAKKIISGAPEFSLVMLGNLLYRHIG